MSLTALISPQKDVHRGDALINSEMTFVINDGTTFI